MSPAQTSTPTTLRAQLRAPNAHLGLRLAIVCASIAGFLGAFVTIAEYAKNDPILFARHHRRRRRPPRHAVTPRHGSCGRAATLISSSQLALAGPVIGIGSPR